VVELPTLSVTASRSGSTVTITATASGARAGNRVVLFRRAPGGLVRVRHAFLDAQGVVTFTARARGARTTYVVRLLATARHGPASAAVTVPRAS
jgi:hypothetical protein